MEARGIPEPALAAPPIAAQLARFQQALAASEAQFRSLIERNVDGFLVVRTDGVLCYANPAAEELLGRSADDLIGHAFGLPIVPGENTEIDLVRPGQAPRAAEMRAVHITWEGRPAYLASLRDVTERKRAEEALRQLAESARESDQRKSRFLAVLGHELRNPLAAIRTGLELLRASGPDPDRQARTHQLMADQVRLMSRLLDDLLDRARISAGKIHLRCEPVDLVALLSRVAQASRAALDAREHQLKLDLPSVSLMLHADPVRLEQVISNLLQNAAKYTDPGGQIFLSCNREPEQAVIRVRDTGIGIAPELLPRIFEPFLQSEAAAARAEGGLGIGLSLVRELVRLHQGDVMARSEGSGRGSEFVVRLPLAAVELSAARPPERGPEPTRSRRVLLVEDNAAHRELLASLLQTWGHHVETAASGPEGLARLLQGRLDVALLDIGLPGLDGYEVGRRVTGVPHRRDLYLIAMTGYGTPADRARARAAGFDHHLVKPVDLAELERLLQRGTHRG